ncbi:hypothetical protein [Streptomyces rubradiris]|uniref:MarR family transcriptional regulator n=1 Tax=Streptomyces rubradiris TaxID=285531 RepID=A0ABQ3RAD3_STRRR|nr:hypothetical protein [Streptomyces rubradiris]GHH26073.1 hypothetical protein GCM10018792_66090 [Streptomyces rubradiris]GHI52814.1 hypothetical protein Srubr_26600 [Streptomyces rubradiris]
MSSPAEHFNIEHWLGREQLHELLCKSGSLPSAASKILMYVASGAPLGQRVEESASAIGGKLHMSTSATSRAVKVLLTERWLEPAGPIVGVQTYRVGPAVYEALELDKDGTPLEDADRPLATVRHLPVPTPID